MLLLNSGAIFFGVAAVNLAMIGHMTSLGAIIMSTLVVGVFTILGVAQFATYIKGGENNKKEG